LERLERQSFEGIIVDLPFQGVEGNEVDFGSGRGRREGLRGNLGVFGVGEGLGGVGFGVEVFFILFCQTGSGGVVAGLKGGEED